MISFSIHDRTGTQDVLETGFPKTRSASRRAINPTGPPREGDFTLSVMPPLGPLNMHDLGKLSSNSGCDVCGKREAQQVHRMSLRGILRERCVVDPATCVVLSARRMPDRGLEGSQEDVQDAQGRHMADDPLRAAHRLLGDHEPVRQPWRTDPPDHNTTKRRRGATVQHPTLTNYSSSKCRARSSSPTSTRRC